MSTRADQLKRYRKSQKEGGKGGSSSKPAEPAKQSTELGHKPKHQFELGEMASLTYVEQFCMSVPNSSSDFKVLTYNEVKAHDAANGGLLTSSNRLTRKFYLVAGVNGRKVILGKRLDPVTETIAAYMTDSARRTAGDTVIKVPLAPRIDGEDTVDVSGIKDEVLDLAAAACNIDLGEEPEEEGGGAPAVEGFTPAQISALAAALGPVMQPMLAQAARDAVDAALAE